jgi:hypothetical protein
MGSELSMASTEPPKMPENLRSMTRLSSWSNISWVAVWSALLLWIFTSLTWGITTSGPTALGIAEACAEMLPICAFAWIATRLCMVWGGEDHIVVYSIRGRFAIPYGDIVAVERTRYIWYYSWNRLGPPMVSLKIARPTPIGRRVRFIATYTSKGRVAGQHASEAFLKKKVSPEIPT